MATKLLSPTTTIWWVPTAGITVPTAPTAAQINAGINLSEAIETGYTLNPTDSDTDDSRSIVDSANVTNFTNENYEAELTFFRGLLGVTATSYYNAFNTFKKAGARGYLVRRVGKTHDQAAAVGDDVSLFFVESDHPRTLATDNNGPIKLQVPFLPQGFMKLFFTLVA